jgi:transcription initiation factor IIE alpha subunit
VEILKLLARSPFRVLQTDICNLISGETKDIKKALSDLRAEGKVDFNRDGFMLPNNFKED